MASQKSAWKRVRFSEMVTSAGATRKARGWTASDEGVERYVGLEHLDANSPKIRRWGSPETVGENSDLRHFEEGDVILARRGIEQRKVGMAEFRGVASGHALVFRARSEVVLPEFLPYFLLSDLFMNCALGFSAGSLSKTVNLSALMKQEFALPPLEEQRRLASLLNCARIAAEACDLAWSGARIAMQALINEHVADEHDALVEVERLVRERVIQAPQDGNHGARHPKAADYTENGVPFLMAADFRDDEINLAACKFISPRLAGSLRPSFRALPGDVLLTHKGTLGASAILGSLPTPYAMLTPQVTYYRVVDAARLMPEYLLLVMRSATFAQQLESHGRQSTRAFVSITSQLRLRIPLPPLERQRTVVERVQSVRRAALALRNRQRLSRLAGVILGNGLR